MTPWRTWGFAHRLMVSYAALILITAGCSGIATVSFFQTRYEARVRQVREAAVKVLGNEIHEGLVAPVRAIEGALGAAYIHPPREFFGVNEPGVPDPMKLQATYRWLCELVFENRASVGAIHLYYPRWQVSISSRWGVALGSDVPPGWGSSWVAELRHRGRSDCWMDSTLTQQPGVGEPAVPVAFFSFPATVAPEETGLWIAVDLEPSWVSSLLTQTGDDDRLVSGAPEAPEVVQRVDGGGLVTAVSVKDSDWRLEDRAPLARVDGDSLPIVLLVAGIWATSVALALGVARMFSSQFSRPVQALLRRIRGLVAGSAGGNEYGLIRRTLDTLVTENQRFLRQNFALALAEGSLSSDEAQTQLSLLGLPLVPRTLTCLKVFWRFAAEADSRQNSLYQFRLLDQWPRLLAPWTLVAPVAGSMVVITQAFADWESTLDQWLLQEETAWSCRFQVLHAPEVRSLADVPQAFEALNRGAEWLFFYPALRITPVTTFRSGHRGLEPGVLQALGDRLRAGDLEGCGGILRSLGGHIRASAAGLGACRRLVSRLEAEIRNGLGALGSVPKDEDELRELCATAGDIDTLGRRLEEFLWTKVQRGQGEDRSNPTIQAIRAFVEAHLGEDLSLAAVGRAVDLSETYLSTLFKTETGTGLLAYVTERRLLAARDFLESTTASVQVTAVRVGFQTPGYFIHQFKRRFGATPAEFRRTRRLNSM